MKAEIIKQIEDLTKELGELVVNLEPTTPQAWDAMERLQAAHKQLRSIDIAELVERPERAEFTR
jgi:hypothetical protein